MLFSFLDRLNRFGEGVRGQKRILSYCSVCCNRLPNAFIFLGENNFVLLGDNLSPHFWQVKRYFRFANPQWGHIRSFMKVFLSGVSYELNDDLLQ
jgi:hypothetical protein